MECLTVFTKAGKDFRAESLSGWADRHDRERLQRENRWMRRKSSSKYTACDFGNSGLVAYCQSLSVQQ